MKKVTKIFAFAVAICMLFSVAISPVLAENMDMAYAINDSIEISKTLTPDYSLVNEIF